MITTVQMHPTNEGLRTLNDDMQQASRLAEVSLDGSLPAAAQRAALRAAQRAGVTMSEYLHERLLLSAGIRAE
jgi:hypothetical protein